MRLALLATADRPWMQRASTTSIRLGVGDVYRVPRHVRRIRIVSGQAWVSFAGKDIVLSPGQHMAFTPHEDVALVSGIDRASLVFEVAKK